MGIATETFHWDEHLTLADKGTGWDSTLHVPPPPTTLATTHTTPLTDSVHITHAKPLYLVVRDHLSTWQDIGAPPHILTWIQDGVFFDTTSVIPTFFHKQLPHDQEALSYWHTKLKPHYLQSGAIRAIPPPPP